MTQITQKIKEKMLEDYKNAVGECLYYAKTSYFRDNEIEIISKEFNLNFSLDYEKFMQQFENFQIQDLEYILKILDIEAENDWTNANRCEASALLLGEYLKIM